MSFEFRPYQKETIDRITEAVVKQAEAKLEYQIAISTDNFEVPMPKKKVFILDAPVGTGKSVINALAGGNLKKSITTTQVQLVDQYKEDTDEGGMLEGFARTVVGRANYPCGYDEVLIPERTDPTADGATCTWKHQDHIANIRRECEIFGVDMSDLPSYIYDGITASTNDEAKVKWHCPVREIGGCPYFNDLAAAKNHTTAITTMAYYMLGVRKSWEGRPGLVIDEAHNLPDALTSHFSISIGANTFPLFPYEEFENAMKQVHKEVAGLVQGSNAKMEKYASMFEEYAYQFDDLYNALIIAGDDYFDEHRATYTPYLSKAVADKTPKECMAYLVKLHERVSHELDKIAIAKRTNWAYTYDEAHKHHIFKPLTLREFIGDFWQPVDFVVLSSATFFDIKGLLYEMHMDEWDVDIIKIPDSFPAQNAPILLMKYPMLSKKNFDKSAPIIMDEIEQIAAHEPERGIIHANSYPLGDYIVKHASQALKSRLVVYNSSNRKKITQDWLTNGKQGSILLAVASEEGLNLKDDLARWQIVAKTPFAYLGDAWVLAKKELMGQQWYDAQAIIKILQACGRVMRSADDHGRTYILDGLANIVLQKYWDHLDSWFKNRVQAGRSLYRVVIPN